MKRTLFCLTLGLLLLCCAAMAETTPPPMPTQPPLMQDAPDDLVLYCNPDGGVKYHLNPRCVSVHSRYLPLAGQFLYGELNDAPYAALKPCAVCGAPLRSETAEPSAPAATAVPTVTPVSDTTPVPVWVNSQSVVDDLRETPIDMPAGDEYLTVNFGVTTWRGDSFHTNAAVGRLDAAPTGLEVVWTVETATDSTGVHAGFSWYSQPAIIQWPKELRAVMNLTEEAANTTALKEVIFASLDGQIYFLNLADGTATREAIAPGYPMLGAVTVHPLGYPLLLAGQYSASLPYTSGSIGLHWYELLTQHQLRFIDGTMAALGVEDADSGAFNTSALIDRNTNTAIALSKDGYLYTEALDMRFIVDDGQILRMDSGFLRPVWAKVTAADEQVTSAPVMHGSCLWFGTDKGRILCVDTTTMQPLWSTQVAQTIYALSMEQDEDGQLWLYTGSATGGIPAGMSVAPMQFFRLNADTGETDWAATLDVRLVSFYEGALAACVVGENALDGLVFFALSDVPGMVIALDKETGEVRWQHGMSSECRSSPVAVYAEDGQGWIIQTDESGLMTLLDGLTGEEVASLDLGGHRWSSPAVYGDMLVIGSCVYGNNGMPSGRIYGVRIRSLQVGPPDAPADPITRLADFLAAWNANDQAAMLTLCSPAWKAQQASPELALFQLVMNRTALAWDIAEQGMEGDDRLYTADVLLDRNNGREPVEYRFTLRVSLESSEYYIIPDGLASGVKAE